MKIKHIREFDEKKLGEKLIEAREKIRDLRFGIMNRQVKNVREIRQLKKDVARMLNERKNRASAPALEKSKDTK